MTDAPSWWWADLGGLPAPRPALDGDREADVCIVGAGYTGLWTAYELLRADPSLRRRRPRARGGRLRRLGAQRRLGAGRGLDGLAPARGGRRGRDRRARARGPGDRRRGRRRVRARGHRLRLRQGRLADRRADRRRSSRACATAPRGELLDVDEAAARVRVAGLRGARFTPHCARVQPAKLARGLAAAVERHGGTIHERTRRRSTSRRAACGRPSGTVRARWVVRATEGYTAGAARPASARCCRSRAR